MSTFEPYGWIDERGDVYRSATGPRKPEHEPVFLLTGAEIGNLQASEADLIAEPLRHRIADLEKPIRLFLAEYDAACPDWWPDSINHLEEVINQPG